MKSIDCVGHAAAGARMGRPSVFREMSSVSHVSQGMKLTALILRTCSAAPQSQSMMVTS